MGLLDFLKKRKQTDKNSADTVPSSNTIIPNHRKSESERNNKETNFNSEEFLDSFSTENNLSEDQVQKVVEKKLEANQEGLQRVHNEVSTAGSGLRYNYTPKYQSASNVEQKKVLVQSNYAQQTPPLVVNPNNSTIQDNPQMVQPNYIKKSQPQELQDVDFGEETKEEDSLQEEDSQEQEDYSQKKEDNPQEQKKSQEQNDSPKGQEPPQEKQVPIENIPPQIIGVFRVNGIYSVAETLMISGIVEEGVLGKNYKTRKDKREMIITELRKGSDQVDSLIENEEGTVFVRASVFPNIKYADLLEFTN